MKQHKAKLTKTNTLISCIYDGTDIAPLPLGFSWSENLATIYKAIYNQTILITWTMFKKNIIHRIDLKVFNKIIKIIQS